MIQKKHFLGILFLLIANLSFSQKFWEMIEDGNYPLEQIKSEAKIFFDVNGTEKGSGYKQYQTWLYNAEMEVDENGYLPSTNQNSNAYNKFKKSQKGNKTLSTTGAWTELGPKMRTRTSSWSPGLGRIECASIDPNNFNHILAGAPKGGAWKSTDAGATWTPLIDFADDLAMLSVVIDPNNSSTYYLGTSSGIYKSTDAGASFTKIKSTTIRKIMVKKDDSNIVIAATSSGIIVSTDAGVTWTTNKTGSYIDLESKPGTPSTIYASEYSTGGVIYSTDAGQTWTSSTGLPVTTSGKTRIAVTEADGTYLYFINANSDVYRSTDSGVSFSLISSGTNYFGTQASYAMGLAVANSDKNRVFVGGVDFFESNDGGATFTTICYWSWKNTPSMYIHADVHDVVSIGSYIFTCTDGGLSRGNDDGTNFVDLSAGCNVQEIYRIGVSQQELGKVTAGSQDNGTALMRDDPSNWYCWLGADGMECFVDWSNPNTIYGTSQYGTSYYSKDNGLTRKTISKPGGVDGAWVVPMEQDPMDADILYLANVNLYKRSIAAGTSSAARTLVSASPSGSNLTHLKIAPTDNNIMYCSSGSNFYKSTDKGATWTSKYSGLSGSVNAIAIDPNDPQRIAVASSSSTARVFTSTDGGNTWTNMKLNLPSLTAYTVRYKSGTEHGLYLGMSVGVYYIDDNLTEWQEFSDGLPHVPVREIEIDETNGILYAGTYGRGLWKSSLYGAGNDFVNDAQLLSVSGLTITGCGLTVNPSFILKNKGTDTLKSIAIAIYLNGTLYSSTTNNSISLAKGSQTTIALGSITGINGANALKIVLSNPNGVTDENTADNETTENFTLQDGVLHSFYIDESSLNTAMTWEISKAGVPVISSASLTPTSNGGVRSYDFCLPVGCYDITITDAFNSSGCSTPAWNSTTVYLADDLAEYNGKIYKAQWWTQNQLPTSGGPWLLQGDCLSSIPTDKYGFKNAETNTPYFETTVASYTSPEVKSFCNGAAISVDFSASATNLLTCQTTTFTANITGGTGTTYAWDFGSDAVPSTATTAGPHTVQYYSSGTKNISLTVDGITKNKSAYITVSKDGTIIPTISIALSSGSNPSCVGETLEFTATATKTGATPIYKWYNNATLMQSGSSTTYTSSTHVTSDDIRCEIVSNELCVSDSVVASSPITLIVDVCTGVNELSNSMIYYPNPASTFLTIENKSTGTIGYRIYNPLGETISMGTLFTKTKNIDLSTYPEGLYFLEINKDGKTLINKFVKK